MACLAIRPANRADYESFKQLIKATVERDGICEVTSMSIDRLFVSVNIGAKTMGQFIDNVLRGNAGQFPVAKDEPRTMDEAVKKMAEEIDCEFTAHISKPHLLFRSAHYGEKCENPDCLGGKIRKREVISSDESTVTCRESISDCPDCAGRGWRIN